MPVDILYDGSTYYVTATDEFSVSDELIEAKAWIANWTVRSEATIGDGIDYDTITNIIEDPGFLILITPAKKIKDIIDVRNFDVTDDGNIIALSTKFIFKISPTGDLLSKKFTIPNLSDNIIDVKWFNGYLWVLHIETIPEDYYHVFNELIGIYDTADFEGEVYGGFYPPYNFLFPPSQWNKILIPAYNIFRISKYNIDTGEVENSFDMPMIESQDYPYSGNHLLSPTSIDIRGNSIIIADQGDASIKSYTLEGVYTGRFSNSSLMTQPTQLIVEDDRYFWVVDKERLTYLPEKYRLKKIDTRFNESVFDEGYSTYPYMDIRSTGGSHEKHLINRVGSTYEYSKNFVQDADITNLLQGHSIELIRISLANYLYLFNFNPFEIRIIDLNTLDSENVRECVKPITITDYFIESTEPDPYAEVAVTDTGLQEVRLYHYYGQKGSLIVDNLLPKGITKQGSVYYITDLRYAAVYKILPGEVQILTSIPFARPTDITNDGVNLYTLDTGNNRIYVSDFDGNVVREIGSTGNGEAQFNYPEGIDIDGNDLYVLDTGNFRVQVLTKEGEYQKEFALAEASDIVYIPQTTTISLSGDQDDAYEKTYGQCMVFGNNYLGYASDNLLAGYQFTIDLENIRIRDAKLRLLKTYTAAHYDVTLTLENASNALPYRSTGVNITDLLNRVTFNETIRWQGDVSLGDIWIETVDFSELLQLIVDKDDWIPGNKISIILRSQLSQTDDLVLIAGIAELVMEYDIIKQTRSAGLFHSISVNDDAFYVTDIAENKLNAYNKITGDIIETYNLGGGSIIVPISNDILLTDEGCRITGINTYNWTVVASYDLELASEATILHYNFEPVWEPVTTEVFERDYFTVETEDFEWYLLTGWALSSEEEFELNVPEITWVI